MNCNNLLKIFLVGSVLASSLAAVAAMPKNSFLMTPVNTTSQLLTEVKSNPTVMDHYRRHFAMNDQQVMDYLSGLHVARMANGAEMLVYGVPTDGVLHATKQKLYKNERVFADASGTPVLRLVCGNPLTLGPRQPFSQTKVSVKASPVDNLRKLSAEVQADPMVLMASAKEPGVPTIVEPVVVPAQPTEPIIDAHPSGGRDALGFIPLLLGGGLLVSKGGNNNTVPNPVPEPASVALVGLGLAGLSRRKKN